MEPIWQIKKFAEKLKQCTSIITGIDRPLLELTEVKDGIMSEGWGDLTVRRFLQLFGTEVGRSIHPDFWINALFSDYDVICHWIITDVRFFNELKAVKDRGGVTIRLLRKNVQNKDVSNHPSEIALDGAHFDHTIDNNGTKEELVSEIRTILKNRHIIL